MERAERDEKAPPPKDFGSLRNLIAAEHGRLPKRLAQVAAFMLDNPDEVALGTSASVAELAKVQPSTLVRFAQTLGFDECLFRLEEETPVGVVPIRRGHRLQDDLLLIRH